MFTIGFTSRRILSAILLSQCALPNRTLAVERVTKDLHFERGDFSEPGQTGFYLLPANGGPAKALGRFPQFAKCGSPSFSPDGKRIAFDAVPEGKEFESSQIVVMDADGTSAFVVGDGLLPSWSVDGRKLACSRNSNYGVWIYDVTSRKATLVAKTGWGLQWSPDGRYQAYIQDGALRVRDVKNGQEFEYSYSSDSSGGWNYNFAWAPDSSRICGVVNLENGQHAVMIVRLNLPQERGPAGPVQITAGEFQLVAAAKADSICLDIAWHPKASRVVVGQMLPSVGQQQLWEFNPDHSSFPWPMSGQTATHNFDPCWSPDGKWLLYVARVPD